MFNLQDSILIEINQLCNLQCEYCFYNDFGREKNNLNIDVLKQILSPSIKKIFFTGGEPFIHPEILDMLFLVKSKKKYCTVFCNGVALIKLSNKEFYAALDNIDNLIISFDSFNENYTYRSIEHQPILETINKVLQYDPTLLEVKIGLNSYNIDELEEILQTLINKGVQKFSVNIIHDIASSDKQFEITHEKMIGAYAIIDKYIKYFDERYINFHKQYIYGDIDNLILSCQAGEKFHFVNNKGKIFGCPANLHDIPSDKKECFSKHCINLWEMY